MEWINPQLDVPFTGVDVLAINDCGRMFVCKYDQSTRVWAMYIHHIDGVNITITINDVKLWQYVPDFPGQ